MNRKGSNSFPSALYSVTSCLVKSKFTSYQEEEEFSLRLSARDADRFLENLTNPPEPTEAARMAAKLFMTEHG